MSKRYRVFELDSTAIYLGPVVVLLVCAFLASGADTLKILGVAAVWLALGSVYFWPRWRTKQRINFYARGWAVITDGAPVESVAVDTNVAQALDWWAHQVGSRIYRVSESGFIVVEVTDDGITAPGRAGLAGVRAPGTEKARGLTDGNNIRVVWEPKNSGRDFYPLLRHEVGHAVLNAIGFQGDHHAEMKRLGSPDA